MCRLRGFSLTETVVVMAIAAILAGIAVPSFAVLLRETRLTAVTNNLLSTLYFARSEALKRNRRVTVCTSATHADCAENIGWQSGWIVFEDRDGDGQRGGAEPILAVSARQNQELTMSGNASLRDYISYVPTGETRSRGGALQMGVVTACEGGSARRIVIAATGRPRIVSRATC
jgi:type IV fimbrial biogenesis protein FimT